MPSIHFRMTDEQHAELSASARESGRSLQRELEWRAFGWKPATAGTFRAPVIVEVPEEVLDSVELVEASPARKTRSKVCEHRVPAGSYCKVCDA